MNRVVDYASLTERTCSRCGGTKSVDEFNRYTDPTQPTCGWRYYSFCRPCQNEDSRRYGTENRARRNARLRAWRQANPEMARAKDRRARLRKNYGLTEDDLAALLDRHDGQCWLCLVRPAVVIDHDHETDRVRGVTCVGCNSVVLARVDADPEFLGRVAAYLDQPCHADVLLELVNR